MADLRSEIEARKSRIAELRRQREAHAASLGTPTPSKSSIVVSAVPTAEIKPVTLYTKVTTAPKIYPKEQNKPTQPEVIEEVNTEASEIAFVDSFVVSQGEFPPSLLSFADNAWRAIARSKQTTAFRDYTSLASETVDIDSSAASEMQPIVSVDGVNTVSWSPHFPDLLACKTVDPRRIHIYSLEANEKPEYTLRSPTALSTNVVFHPTTPRYVFCGGSNGQLLAWDLNSGGRHELLPQRRSPADGNRVIALQFNKESASLISLSENGVVSVWPGGDQLTRPQHRIVLDDVMRNALTALRIGVLVPVAIATCFPAHFGFGLGYGTGITVISSVTGHLLQLPALPSATSQGWGNWRHDAPVTSLAFRLSGYSSQGDGKEYAVLLSGGLDWKLRVWLVPIDDRGEEPQLVAEILIDFAVQKLQWHPTYLSLLVAAGEDQCQIWDLNRSTVTPYVSRTFEDVQDVQFAPENPAMLAVISASDCTVWKYIDGLVASSDAWIDKRV